MNGVIVRSSNPQDAGLESDATPQLSRPIPRSRPPGGAAPSITRRSPWSWVPPPPRPID